MVADSAATILTLSAIETVYPPPAVVFAAVDILLSPLPPATARPRPPTLFLICHTLYRDAQFVFFSRNRFIIHDFHAEQPWDLPAEQLDPDSPETASTNASYPFERLAVAEFLREVVPIHCLTYLRFLKLVFPPYVPHGWPYGEHPAILDWVATVDWVRKRVNTPALTLRLVIADFGGSPIIGRKVMTKALTYDIIRGYVCIIGPLRALARGHGSGLAGFYLQLHTLRDGPWMFSGVHNRTTGSWPDCTETSLRGLSGICGAAARVPLTISTGLT